MNAVSIIIPTYNGEKTLDRAIKSVINQTERCYREVIICDDCSTDKTIEVAKQYNCKIILNPYHIGAPDYGRNNGILNAVGNYIAFLDQDDEWLPYKLELQFKEIKKGVDIVYSGYIKNDKIYKNEFYFSSLLIKNKNIPLCNIKYSQRYEWFNKLKQGRTYVETEPVVIRYIHHDNQTFEPEYRRWSFYMHLLYLNDTDIESIKKLYGSRARYFYYMNKVSLARFYFWRSSLTWKNILYFITSYSKSIRKFVIKKFNVYG